MALQLLQMIVNRRPIDVRVTVSRSTTHDGGGRAFASIGLLDVLLGCAHRQNAGSIIASRPYDRHFHINSKSPHVEGEPRRRRPEELPSDFRTQSKETIRGMVVSLYTQQIIRSTELAELDRIDGSASIMNCHRGLSLLSHSEGIREKIKGRCRC